MTTRITLLASVVLAIAATATPAAAVTNLIKNGSFEAAGTIGSGAFTSWTRSNVPDFSPAQDQPASVIVYNSTASYPVSAYSEAVTPDNALSASPDAVGSYGAYFVGDFSVDEKISQLTYLGVGNYRVGFSYYLTANGLANAGNSGFQATIIGVPVASTMIDGSSIGKTWFYASGVGHISKAGIYTTAFEFDSNAFPSKDIVIDRVFAVRTNVPFDVEIPPFPSVVPEPEAWGLMVLGFGLVGAAGRRRTVVVAA